MLKVEQKVSDSDGSKAGSLIVYCSTVFLVNNYAVFNDYLPWHSVPKCEQ